MKISNDIAPGEIFYGLHMVPGIAEYAEQKDAQGNSLRIFIGEETIKNMDPTFAGRPVYVHHVDGVDKNTVRTDADGWVSESFYNKADGKHWVKFVMVSEAGKLAIRNGWKLSNAYHMKEMAGGGRWHGVDFSKEVMRGEYEHLAIVPNPRYEESVILTPEDFKTYNSNKETELYRLANSKKGETKMKFNFFKKERVENDINDMLVTLPKSGKEVSIETLVNEMDMSEMNADKPYMCNGSERVKVGEEEMSVNELIEKHTALKSAMAPKEEVKPVVDEKKPMNEEPDKAKNAIEAIKNAEIAKLQPEEKTVDLIIDQVARGKSRYGSN